MSSRQPNRATLIEKNEICISPPPNFDEVKAYSEQFCQQSEDGGNSPDGAESEGLKERQVGYGNLYTSGWLEAVCAAATSG